MNHEKVFFQNLAALAEMCNHRLGEHMVAVYDRGLSDIGYEKLNEALTSIMTTRRANHAFPSIRDIRGLIEPVQGIEDAASTILGRCIEAISAYGYTDPASARVFIGESGWAALPNDTGWQEFCQSREPSICRAQLKKRLEARLRADNPNGVVRLPPAQRPEFKELIPFEQSKSLPEGPVPTKVEELMAGIGSE